MDIGISNRSIAPLPYSTARIDVVPVNVKNAVGTVMPQTDYAVASLGSSEKITAWSSEHARFMTEKDARTVDEIKERLEREFEYNITDRELIFRVIDTRNGEVVVQTPTEAMLKLRTFFKEMGIDTFISSKAPEEPYPFETSEIAKEGTEEAAQTAADFFLERAEAATEASPGTAAE